MLRDIDTYLAGANAYFKKNNPTATPLTRNDIYSVMALKGQFVGQGGGDEAGARSSSPRWTPASARPPA